MNIRHLIPTICALAVISLSHADQLARWDFAGEPGNQTNTVVDATAANVVASAITRGGNITATTTANAMSSTSWDTASIDPNAFYQFSITIDSGYTANLTNMTFSDRKSGTGPTNASLRSSSDGYLSDLATFAPGTSDTNRSLNLTSLTGINGTVTFRIFGWGASASGGTYRINNGTVGGLTINGVVTSTGGNGTVDNPSGFSSTTADKDKINLAWTPNGAGNPVVLACSEDGTFGAPANNVTYSANDALGNATVVYVGNNTTFSDTGLCPSTTYTYKIWSLGGGNYSSGVTANATTFTYDLQGGASFDSWQKISVDGDNYTWSGSATTQTANGFNRTSSSSDEYLISPAVNLTGFINKSLDFSYFSRFVDTAGPGLQIQYSSNYNGNGTAAGVLAATWTNITYTDLTTNAANSNATTSTFDGSVPLSLNGTVYLAFRYTSSGNVTDNARSWTVLDPLISGDQPGIGNITLSATSTTVTENTPNATTLTITLSPAPVGNVTVCLQNTDSDNSELALSGNSTLPHLVVVGPSGTANLVLDAKDDLDIDGPQVITLTANTGDYRVKSIDITVNDNEAAPSPSNLIINQYYEGASFDKYIELKNVGNTTIDLSTYNLALFSNANREIWKNAGNASATGSVTLNGTLSPGSLFLLANGNASTPAYAVANVSQFSTSVINFNGDDSIVLYNGTLSRDNVVDAFSVSASTATDKSFTRNSTSPGYDFGNGTSYLSYPAVWTQVTLAVVANATSSDPAYLGQIPMNISLSADLTTTFETSGVTGTGSVTLTQPAPIGGLNVTLTSSDASELTTPSFVLVPEGNTTANFTITAVDDAGAFDANALVTLTGSASGWNQGTCSILVYNTDAPPAPSTVVISQYYQDNATASNFIEITNISASPIDLTGWTLGQFYSPNAETWSNNATANDTADLGILGTLPAGATRVIGFNGSITPANTTVDLTTGHLDLFGSDTVALYNGPVNFANLVDVVSMTDLKTAPDTSIVRQTNGAGFSTDPTTAFSDFPSVWSTVTLATVNNAATGDNNHLGTYPGGAAPITYASYIASQSGSGGNATTDDKNNNGVRNIEEYAFDSDRSNSPSGDITGRDALRNVAGGSLSNNGTNSTITDDRLAYTLTIPSPAPTDVTYVIRAGNSPGNATDTLATFHGSNSTWVTGNGTVHLDSPSAGQDSIHDSQTIGTQPRRFIWLELTSP